MDETAKARAVEALRRFQFAVDRENASARKHSEELTFLTFKFKEFLEKTLPAVTGDVTALLKDVGLRAERHDAADRESVTVKVGKPGPIALDKAAALTFRIEPKFPIVAVYFENARGAVTAMPVLSAEELGDTTEIENVFADFLERLATEHDGGTEFDP